MNIHEYQSAELFRSVGIKTGQGNVATSLEEAKRIAEEIGFPVVIKAQVLVGGRGKAGGVKVVKRKDDFDTIFSSILGMDLKGFIVEKLLVVRAIDIKREFYLAVTLDPSKSSIVLIGSASGGVDIEEVAASAPEKIHKMYLSTKDVPQDADLKTFCQKIFDTPDGVEAGVSTFSRMFKVFVNKDCSLVEINPFAYTHDKEWLALDAKINFDDNALMRHDDIASLRDLKMEDADEVKARELGLSFVKLDGDIGCIVNGAGLAMATMDIVNLMGGESANFLDVGGSSNPQKMVNAIKIILNNPKVKGILINIFGGITRCDDIANGLLMALNEVNLKIPYVIRLTGTNEKEARAILKEKGIDCFNQMEDAVKKIIELTK